VHIVSFEQFCQLEGALVVELEERSIKRATLVDGHLAEVVIAAYPNFFGHFLHYL